MTKCIGKRGECTNEARYITAADTWLCGICDIASPWRSVRISDIPQLLRIVDALAFVVVGTPNEWIAEKFEEVAGKSNTAYQLEVTCPACLVSPDPRGWSACADCRARREHRESVSPLK